MQNDSKKEKEKEKEKTITMQIYWKASAYNGTLKLRLKSNNIFLVSWLHQFNCETASCILTFKILYH